MCVRVGEAAGWVMQRGGFGGGCRWAMQEARLGGAGVEVGGAGGRCRGVKFGGGGGGGV